MWKSKIYAAVLWCLVIGGVSACSNDSNPVTAPQPEGTFSQVQGNSSQPAVTVSNIPQRDIKAATETAPAPGFAAVKIYRTRGWGADLYLNTRGDYLIDYQATDGKWYSLMLRTRAPVKVAIGVNPGFNITEIDLYYGFTWIAADAAALKYKIGNASFFLPSGVTIYGAAWQRFLDLYNPMVSYYFP